MSNYLPCDGTIDLFLKFPICKKALELTFQKHKNITDVLMVNETNCEKYLFLSILGALAITVLKNKTFNDLGSKNSVDDIKNNPVDTDSINKLQQKILNSKISRGDKDFMNSIQEKLKLDNELLKKEKELDNIEAQMNRLV